MSNKVCPCCGRRIIDAGELAIPLAIGFGLGGFYGVFDPEIGVDVAAILMLGSMAFFVWKRWIAKQCRCRRNPQIHQPQA